MPQVSNANFLYGIVTFDLGYYSTRKAIIALEGYYSTCLYR
jgi:hypothetical protein